MHRNPFLMNLWAKWYSYTKLRFSLIGGYVKLHQDPVHLQEARRENEGIQNSIISVTSYFIRRSSFKLPVSLSLWSSLASGSNSPQFSNSKSL
jgi:hypothetical protein